MTLLSVCLEAMFDIPIDPTPKLLEALTVTDRRLEFNWLDLRLSLLRQTCQRKEKGIQRRVLLEEFKLEVDAGSHDETIQVRID